MPKTFNTKVIRQETLDTSLDKRRGQTMSYRELLRVVIDDVHHRLRVRIESDAYAEQSFALIERWSTHDQQWHLLESIPPLAMRTAPGLAYQPTMTIDFKSDRDQLVKLSLLTLA